MFYIRNSECPSQCLGMYFLGSIEPIIMMLQSLYLQSSDVWGRRIFPLLSLKDVCRLDSAVTDSQLKKVLLEVQRMGYMQRMALQSETVLCWVLKKKLKALEIEVGQFLSEEQVCAIIRHNGAELLILNIKMKCTNRIITTITSFSMCLQNLRLWSCENLTSDHLHAISSACGQLVKISLRSCKNVLDDGICALSRNCPQLKCIYLKNLDKVTDQSIVHIAEEHPDLISLSIQLCKLVSDASMQAVAEHCSCLTTLHLLEFPLTDASMIGIAKKCQNLRVLTLCAHEITAAAILAVAEHCRFLQQVYLAHIPGDDDLEAATSVLFEKCSQLEVLEMQGFHARILEVAARFLPELKALSLIGCTEITDGTMNFIATHFPQLQILVLWFHHDVTGDALVDLVRRCGKLRELNQVAWRALSAEEQEEESGEDEEEELPPLLRSALEECKVQYNVRDTLFDGDCILV